MSTLSIEAIDIMDRKLNQLTALLTVSSCESFHDFNTITKSGYLWLCSELANDIQRSFTTATKDDEAQA
jgi:hypothetical protein